MKSSLFSFAFGLLSMAASVAAHAQAPVIKASQPVERARIRQGMRSGELTRTEAARLRAREAHISAEKRAAHADGVVTRGERHEIRSAERRTSRAIYHQKHDAQVR